MVTFIIILIIAGAVLWLFANRKSPEERERERIEKEKQLMFSFEYPQLQRIINESLEIINRTKNIDTAIGRFDTIKTDMQRLLEIAPSSAGLSMQIQGNYIRTVDDLTCIDIAKKDWIKSFFNNKIDIEIRKTDVLSNPKLQATQYKKALNIALKAIDYLPDDKDFQERVRNIEGRLDGISSIIENKKASLKEWTALFKKAIEDGKITDEEMKELEEFEKKAGLSDEDTVNHWARAFNIGITIDSKNAA